MEEKRKLNDVFLIKTPINSPSNTFFLLSYSSRCLLLQQLCLSLSLFADKRRVTIVARATSFFSSLIVKNVYVETKGANKEVCVSIQLFSRTLLAVVVVLNSFPLNEQH